MHFAALFAAASLAVSGAMVTPSAPPLGMRRMLGFNLSSRNYYGAHIPPWLNGTYPGWYFGKKSTLGSTVLIDTSICTDLLLLPGYNYCPANQPSSSDGKFEQTFAKRTGATQADDYITYGCVDTVDQCKAMCKAVTGCKFINTYDDVNSKQCADKLTCSLFKNCHDDTDNKNIGGQLQPDGTVNHIDNSDGYCLK